MSVSVTGCKYLAVSVRAIFRLNPWCLFGFFSFYQVDTVWLSNLRFQRTYVLNPKVRPVSFKSVPEPQCHHIPFTHKKSLEDQYQTLTQSPNSAVIAGPQEAQLYKNLTNMSDWRLKSDYI